MKLNFSFAEVGEYVKEHYGKSVVLSRVGDKELCVTYQQKIVIKTFNVSVNIAIEDVRPDGVTIKYDGGLGVDTLISGALMVFKSAFSELSAMVIPEDGHRIRVELSEVKQAQKALEMLALKDVWVTGEGVSIEASLK
ncbi:MAG: hypothetical protein HDR83_00440 [Bacteroides sp.]|nr:hypothetical protein [Bacteroides sp.]